MYLLTCKIVLAVAAVVKMVSVCRMKYFLQPLLPFLIVEGYSLALKVWEANLSFVPQNLWVFGFDLDLFALQI